MQGEAIRDFQIRKFRGCKQTTNSERPNIAQQERVTVPKGLTNFHVYHKSHRNY